MAARDPVLDRLLDLDGYLAMVDTEHWVKFVVHRVPADDKRPAGIAYALTLHDSEGRRIFGIDNAHGIRGVRGPAGRSSMRHDHLHRGETVRPYVYRDADTLLEDFWREVEAILREAGQA